MQKWPSQRKSRGLYHVSPRLRQPWAHLQATATTTWQAHGPHDHGAGCQSRTV